MGMNQELSLEAGPYIAELTLHKNCFSKQTHGEKIMPPYSIKTLVSNLSCKEQESFYCELFHAVFAATNGFHFSPFVM